jgi:hypothetical protein
MRPSLVRPPVLLAALLLVAACSGGGDGGATPRTTAARRATTTTSTSTSTTTTVVAPAPAQPPAGACPAVPPRVEPRPDRTRYRATVDLRPGEGRVVGTLGAVFTPDRPTDRLVFRLWPNAPRTARFGARLAMAPPEVEGTVLAVEQPDPTLVVARLARPLAAGEAVEVATTWELALPSAGTNDRVSRTGDAVRLGSFLPLLAWEPGVGWATDPPTTVFAEASMTPTADFAVAISVPQGLGVLATGVPDGAGRWVAAAVPDFALSVGRFRTVSRVVAAPGPVQVTVGVDAAVPDDPAPYLDKVSRVLADFGARFGPYPWPTYTLALTPELSGGIEYPMHVMQGPGRIGRTTSHEVGHMWFYGLVGSHQGRDPWLDEGLATWAEARWEGTLGEMRATAVPAEGRGRVGRPMAYWEARQRAYYRSVYVQGAQVLAALGPPDLVDCGLRHYVARTAYRVARPADLLAAAQVVFPGAAEVFARYGAAPA